MLVRDRIYMAYRDSLNDFKIIVLQEGFRRFIESRRYLKARQKYLEFVADLPNRTLDARVNSLLQGDNIIMENKERSPRKEKKKPKKKKWPNTK